MLFYGTELHLTDPRLGVSVTLNPSVTGINRNFEEALKPSVREVRRRYPKCLEC